MNWGQAEEVELLSSEAFLTSQDGLQLCNVTDFMAKSEVNLHFGFLHRLARDISLVFVTACHRQQTLQSRAGLQSVFL